MVAQLDIDLALDLGDCSRLDGFLEGRAGLLLGEHANLEQPVPALGANLVESGLLGGRPEVGAMDPEMGDRPPHPLNPGGGLLLDPGGWLGRHAKNVFFQLSRKKDGGEIFLLYSLYFPKFAY